MKKFNFNKILLLSSFIAILFIIIPNAYGQELTAKIKVDTERQISEIDKMIYGNFIEHLGRCIYGGIYEPGSPLSDNQGFRKDVLKATKDLNTSIVRWPGGNFVSGYHWEDGIGPVDKRPTRIDLAWGGHENNAFGTDEFIKWCRTVGTEPYFCVNLGTGTLDEARNWVEYCNIEKGTYYSDLRRSNGFEKPHKVIYWGLGNEIDGPWQMGHKNAVDYSKYALEAAKLMKWIDKEIKLVAAGSSFFDGDWINWNRTVLDYTARHIDYISLHHYSRNKENNYYDFMAATLFAEETIKITEGLIRETQMKKKMRKPIYISFDEWNVWYRAQGHEGNEEVYNLEDALVVAQYLNVFLRNANIVKMANMAQLVNVIAPVFTSKEGMWYQTIYYPLELFAANCYGKSLDAYVECDTYKSNSNDIPYLDVSSSYDENKNELIINVVNRHKDKVIKTDILSQTGVFKDTATIYEVNGTDIKIENSASAQNVKTVTNTLKVNGNKMTYSFPPHSYTMIKLIMKK